MPETDCTRSTNDKLTFNPRKPLSIQPNSFIMFQDAALARLLRFCFGPVQLRKQGSVAIGETEAELAFEVLYLRLGRHPVGRIDIKGHSFLLS